jgi:hypothetical protein
VRLKVRAHPPVNRLSKRGRTWWEGALDAFELNGSWADVGWQLAGGLVPLALYLFIFFGRRFSRSGKGPLAFSMIGAMTLACAGLLPAALLSAQMASTRVSATIFVDLAEAYSIRHALDIVCRRQRTLTMLACGPYRRSACVIPFAGSA